MSKEKKPLLGIPPHIRVTNIVKSSTQTNSQSELAGLTARERMQRQSQDLVRQQLHKPSPKALGGQITDPFMEVDDSWAVMPVMSIQFYENNPRIATNEVFEELKDSIRINGILQPLTVTKRPGESNYILYAGGNTRLRAIRDLWEETQDQKYYETRVIIKKWRGEASVLLAHMAENTQRNDMTFWDKANGILKIKEQLESDLGKSLSHRELESELKKAGIGINLQSISSYKFAKERLSDLGKWLSQNSLRDIQPYLNLLSRLCKVWSDLDEDTFYDSLVKQVGVEYSEFLNNPLSGDGHEEKRLFSQTELIKRLNSSVAKELNINLEQLRKMLSALERFKDKDFGKEELSQLIKPSQDQENLTNKLNAADSLASRQIKTESVSTNQNSKDTELSTNAHRVFMGHETGDIELSGEAIIESIQQDDYIKQTSDTINNKINRLISIAGIANCVKEAPGMPLGFYLGFPNDGPLDLKDNARNRQAAWWVVSMATGQFNQQLCKKHLPPDDPWRSLVLEEITEETQTLGELELSIENNIGSEGEFFSITWLLDSTNEVSSLCLEIMLMLKSNVMGGSSWK